MPPHLESKTLNSVSCFIKFVNGITMILSLGLLSAVVFLRLGVGVVRDFVIGYLDPHLQAAREAGMGDLHVKHLDIERVCGAVSVLLTVVALYGLATAISGQLGTIMKLSILIKLSEVLLGSAVLLEILAVVLVFSRNNLLSGILTPALLTTLQEQYRGFNETDFLTNTWNIVMVTLHCCGVTDYEDFATAGLWRRKVFQDGRWFRLTTPIPCCRMDIKSPDDFSCAVNPTPDTSYLQISCYERVLSAVVSQKTTLFAVIGVTLAVQIVQFSTFAIQIHLMRKLQGKQQKKNNSLSNGRLDMPSISNEQNENLLGPWGTRNFAQNMMNFGRFYNSSRFKDNVNSPYETRQGTQADLLAQIFGSNLMESNMGFTRNNLTDPILGGYRGDYPDLIRSARQGTLIVQLPSPPRSRGRHLALQGPPMVQTFVDHESLDDSVKLGDTFTSPSSPMPSRNTPKLKRSRRGSSENHETRRNLSKSYSEGNILKRGPVVKSSDDHCTSNKLQRKMTMT